MSPTQVGLPPFRPGWTAEGAETWWAIATQRCVKFPASTIRKGFAASALRVSLLLARQSRGIVTNYDRCRKPYQCWSSSALLSAAPRLCGEEHFRPEAEPR
jgi:hypothetical protein